MNKCITILASFSFFFFMGCSSNPEFTERPSEQPQLNEILRILDQSSEEKMVDLLVVVDNSTSMLKDQEKLSREFVNFVNAISDADYRVGVITTDTDSSGNENRPGFHGNLDIVSSTGLRYITKKDANPSALFSDLINRKETKVCEDAGRVSDKCPSFEERPLYAIKQAIDKRNTVNRGFFRRGADLGVIIISDEDETDFKRGGFYSATDLLNHFENEFEESKKMNAFNIAILDGDQDCLEAQAAETNGGVGIAARPGLRTGELADLTGGFKANICSENYGRAIQEISRYVKRNLIPLTVDVPDTIVLESVRLKITTPDGKPFKADFTLNGKTLRIFPSPPEGSLVELTYKY